MTYRHILVPTDGSSLALEGAKRAVSLAQDLHARLTALYVAPGFSPSSQEAAMFGRTVEDSRRLYEERCRVEAHEALAQVGALAEAAQVQCEGVADKEMPPWQSIVETARREECDLIVMASHGRGYLGSVLMGSQTQQVLAHSRTPVLVCR